MILSGMLCLDAAGRWAMPLRAEHAAKRAFCGWLMEELPVGMRFPIDVTRQKRCPVCKTAGPGTNPPDTPRSETASLSFAVYATTPGRTPVVLGGDLFLGWDAGVCSHPKSRTSLGAVVRALRAEAPGPNEGLLKAQFCSIACLRQFLMAAVDELESRAEAIKPKVRTARERSRGPADRST